MGSKTASSRTDAAPLSDTGSPDRGVEIVLALGSNQGDSRGILHAASAILAERLARPRLSSLYESEPMYVLDQPPYLNAVLVGLFSGTPRELLTFAQEVEARFGRDRSRERRRGERTLDVDILLFGDSLIDESPILEIPHPALNERKFALLPLLELLPEAIDPRSGQPFADLLSLLGDQGIYYADLDPYNRRQWIQ